MARPVDPAGDSQVTRSARVRALRECSPAQRGEAIQQLGALLCATQAALCDVITAADAEQDWRVDGATGMAPWLVGTLHVTLTTAREWVRAGAALDGLAHLQEAFAEGMLSWDQVRPASTFVTATTDEEQAQLLAVVHVPAEVVDGHVGGNGTIDGLQVAPDSVLRLLCDCKIEFHVDGPDGATVGIARGSRSIPRWMRRRIRKRDGGTCRFPGCDRHIRQIHHIEHWARGGGTDAPNLTGLCCTTTTSSTKAPGPSPATPTTSSPSPAPTGARPAPDPTPSPPGSGAAPPTRPASPWRSTTATATHPPPAPVPPPDREPR